MKHNIMNTNRQTRNKSIIRLHFSSIQRSPRPNRTHNHTPTRIVDIHILKPTRIFSSHLRHHISLNQQRRHLPLHTLTILSLQHHNSHLPHNQRRMNNQIGLTIQSLQLSRTPHLQTRQRIILSPIFQRNHKSSPHKSISQFVRVTPTRQYSLPKSHNNHRSRLNHRRHTQPSTKRNINTPRITHLSTQQYHRPIFITFKV